MAIWFLDFYILSLQWRAADMAEELCLPLFLALICPFEWLEYFFLLVGLLFFFLDFFF